MHIHIEPTDIPVLSLARQIGQFAQQVDIRVPFQGKPVLTVKPVTLLHLADNFLQHSARLANSWLHSA